MKVPIRCLRLLSIILFAGIAYSGASERGVLRVGIARVDVTPPVNPAAPPSGKYDHERMYVRAIVLDKPGLPHLCSDQEDVRKGARL